MEKNNNSEILDIVIRDKIQLSLTITFTILYSILFISAYIQLWLVLYLKHKLVSTQTIYFFLCCIFTGLRIVLFSYFYNDFELTKKLSISIYWILNCLPIIIQYMIVLLITLFYYKTYVKVNNGFKAFQNFIYKSAVISILLMISINLLPVLYRKPNKSFNYFILPLISFRIICTDVLFIFILSIFVHVYRQFPKYPNAKLVQEVKRVTTVRSNIVSTVVLLLVLLKLVYDIAQLTIMSNRKTIKYPSVFEQADYAVLYQSWPAFVIFGMLLFFWEVAPLIAIMIVFRVNLPDGVLKVNSDPMLANGRFYQTLSSANSQSISVNSTINSPIKSNFISVPRYGALYSTDSSGPVSPVWQSPPLQHPRIIGIRGGGPTTSNEYIHQIRGGTRNGYSQQVASSSWAVNDNYRNGRHILPPIMAGNIESITNTNSNNIINKKEKVITRANSNNILQNINNK